VSSETFNHMKFKHGVLCLRRVTRYRAKSLVSQLRFGSHQSFTQSDDLCAGTYIHLRGEQGGGHFPLI